MTPQMGWAIAGIGAHADRYIAPALGKAVGATLVAVYSRDQSRADAFARKHGAPGCRGYTSLDALLADPAVQAVYVASPDALHAPQTIAAARAGKHVLCEKPMATTVSDAQAMIAACAQAGVKLGLGFHLRHHPAHIQARGLIREGKLGPVSLACAQWHSPGGGTYTGLRTWKADPALAAAGVLAGYGVHCVDLLRYLVGQEVVEVSAFTDATGERLDDQVTALFRFEGGAMGLLASSRRAPLARSVVEVHGPLGSLYGLGTPTQRFAGELELVLRDGTTRTGYPKGDLYQAQIEAFQSQLVGMASDTEPDASGLDGLRTVEITQAILRSHREGRAIRLGLRSGNS
ncbi:MAG: Gfo/Idh/MocA family oxidoreductase [Chloroflexi bacterium]|nr:Gfo/Idh/MocA family oxidoreductase [Chloroflexota bacterium]